MPHLPEVLEQAWTDGVPAAPWRTAGGDDGDVKDVLPVELLHVVEAAEVHELSEELERGLSTVLLGRRHVQVVDEHQHLSATHVNHGQSPGNASITVDICINND